MEGLGSELRRRGISRHAQWGAQGIVYVVLFHSGLIHGPCIFRNYLTASTDSYYKQPLKRSIFSSDVAVQTDAVSLSTSLPLNMYGDHAASHDDQESTLSASDLAAILKWSKAISSDINLSSGGRVHTVHLFNYGSHPNTALQRLTEIASGNCLVTSAFRSLTLLARNVRFPEHMRYSVHFMS